MSFYYLKREGTNETLLGGQATSSPMGLALPCLDWRVTPHSAHSLGSPTSPLGKRARMSLAEGCQVPVGTWTPPFIPLVTPKTTPWPVGSMRAKHGSASSGRLLKNRQGQPKGPRLGGGRAGVEPSRVLPSEVLLRSPLSASSPSAHETSASLSSTLPQSSIWGSEQTTETNTPEGGHSPLKVTQHVV